jgi:hypothetical protein
LLRNINNCLTIICKQNKIQSLDFFVSFFVKKKRKESRIIAQNVIIVFKWISLTFGLVVKNVQIITFFIPLNIF